MMFRWLTFAFDMLVLLGFIAAAVAWAKRVGGAAPWLLAAVGVIDGALICMFRVVFVVGRGSSDYQSFERAVNVLQLLDSASMFLCGGLVLVAFFLMMPKTVR